MAKPIVTFESVSKAAQTLTQKGLTPTILLVKDHIGAGSFTTVKKYLDAWREEQASKDSSAPPTPAAVADKAIEFARSVWSVAHQETQQTVIRLQAETQAKTEKLLSELSDTTQEVARLESIEAEQAQEISNLTQALETEKQALLHSQLVAQRVPDWEKAAHDLKQSSLMRSKRLSTSRSRSDMRTARKRLCKNKLRPIPNAAHDHADTESNS